MEVSRAINVAFDGDVVLSTVEFITESHEGYEPYSYNAYTGYTTGCLALTGVDDVTVKVTGQGGHPISGTALKGNNSAQFIRISYTPVLAIGPAGSDFSDIFEQSRTFGPDQPFWFYYNYSPSQGVNVDGLPNDLFGAPAVIGNTSCETAGSNIAFGAIVGIDGGPGPTSAENRVWGTVNEFLDFEEQLAAGSYSFSDTVTVEITPRL